ATAFVPMYGTLWSFRYASAASDPSALDPGLLRQRMADRLDPAPGFANAAMWPALFAADPIIAEAGSHPAGRVIVDAEPDFPDAFDVV
ncbi:MAG: hypothetical protein KKB59_14485, partial [Spirochaetes bacterium]|nr:hypothetical protein [Spirochaetota bacterium]